MANISYVLVRLTDPLKFPEAIAALEGVDGVLGWSAVQGGCDLILKMNVPVPEITPALKKIGPLSDISTCGVTQENVKRELSADKSHLYLFIETDQKKKIQVREKLEILPETASVGTVTGPADLVVLLEAESLHEIDAVIEGKISDIEGVLRIKKYRVINLKNI